MSHEIIRKRPAGWPVAPQLADYDAARSAFSWEAARAELSGLPGGRGLNIAHETVDRHAGGRDGARVALRCLRKDGRVEDYSYRRLAELTSRFANLLGGLGVAAGDRVAVLLGRVPELFVAVLGTLKARAVLSPLFSAYGPALIEARLRLGDARVLVTTATLYRRKVAQLRSGLPGLTHVLLVAEDEDDPVPGTDDFHARLAAASPDFTIPPTDPEDLALLHFTSGTTGAPKGALHVHAAVIAHHSTARLALDLRPQDRYWCTADPGWVTGISYGVIAPLAVGATLIVDEAEFDALRWCRVLVQHQVNVWYTAPTALRMMRKLGQEVFAGFDFRSLRFIASVGEPLSGTAIAWADEVIGRPVHDTWWQTETGAIMIANFAAADIKLGSMGRPMPGIEAAVVRRTSEGAVVPVTRAEEEGELVLRVAWPSMFRGYLGDEERYRRCFADGWYLTGDLARRDEDGYFWFLGRADEVIKSAGHLIGPFEVEAVLMQHPAVAEVGVIGKPDAVVMETVKAFVSLRAGWEPSDTLRRELMAHARQRLGPAVAPKEIEFRGSLPKTRSGKIVRRLLRAWELGLPDGDVSALEEQNDEGR